MPPDRVAEVEALLDRVHAALMAGDLSALPACVAMLETLGDPPFGTVGADALQRLRAKADRNARCLEAAGRGLRAAQRRLAEIRGAGRALNTYDGTGQRQAIAPAAPQVMRRL
jgi:NADPH-dependent ferric siderophore reductase